MKKVLMTLVTVALILTCVFAFVACKKEQADGANTDIGGNAPDASEGVVATTADMTGETMFLNAVNNYYKNNNVQLALQVGNVNTKVMGTTTIQKVEGLRMRKNGDIFMYNNSYTSEGMVNIKVMEQYYVSGGKVDYISTGKNKNVEIKDGKMKAKKWDVDKSFDSLGAYLDDNPNDPTLLNMYILNEDVVTETSTPELKTTDNGDEYYSFTVTCDGKAAFKDYIPVMEHMLNQSVSGTVSADKAQTLVFDVQIWKNGLFKQYDVEEGYSVDVLKVFNGDIVLNSTVYFGYDEEVYKFSDYYDGGFVKDIF